MNDIPKMNPNTYSYYWYDYLFISCIFFSDDMNPQASDHSRPAATVLPVRCERQAGSSRQEVIWGNFQNLSEQSAEFSMDVMV